VCWKAQLARLCCFYLVPGRRPSHQGPSTAQPVLPAREEPGGVPADSAGERPEGKQRLRAQHGCHGCPEASPTWQPPRVTTTSTRSCSETMLIKDPDPQVPESYLPIAPVSAQSLAGQATVCCCSGDRMPAETNPRPLWWCGFVLIAYLHAMCHPVQVIANCVYALQEILASDSRVRPAWPGPPPTDQQNSHLLSPQQVCP